MIYHTHTVQQSSKPTCWHHIVRYRRDFGTVQSPPVNWSWLNLHLLCRSHMPDPCLAPSPNAKQFTTGFGVVFFTRSEHSTPPSPLTPWENKNVFFFCSFSISEFTTLFHPSFPSLHLWVTVLPRESKPFTLCTPKPISTVNSFGVFFKIRHTLDHCNRPISSVAPIRPSELPTLLCKFTTGH